ncbi:MULTISPECIES: TetR/AcrR family transcriptional regulator [unclassified Treponema]|uniref:TetR/AcrR family transcriptional regulator n=1 Tax=unclassified Treponema TaxID=2638727 RepID=UPI0020A3615C|nr:MULTISPECIES: TetR/AcrR family transcriptional regulator [unclassified Treponema]UTC66144.1 TetR/AcrR family transcriptional regulator [Treponema sp. OMZ 789]UTC68873.1 TetR/AcrR family transcriptional regulator [Treponema sp. OMZ 790]UTC71601.1 TetR/AcrR family transcriptional regulator [Treponema sp. OMZ 791]
MPANFTKEEREILIRKFYEQGYVLLKTHGYKKLKVSDIAAAIGIGTGTFYNFFKSKDEFIIWLIKKRKEEAFNLFLSLAEKFPKGIPFEAMEQYLIDTISHFNLYRLLSQAEYNKLQKKYGLLDNRNEQTKENGKFMMEKLATSKTLEDFLLFADAFTIIVIGTSDLTKLNPKVTDEVTKKLIHAACKMLY